MQSALPQREREQIPARLHVSSLEFSFRTRSGLRERLLAPSEYSGSGTRLIGEISNEQAGYLHFHRFFAYLCSGIFDFNFISTGNHRAVAKMSDVVLPGMARSYSTLVRRISRSFSAAAKLARLGLEFYRGGNRKLLGENADFAGCQGRGKCTLRLAGEGGFL